MTTFGRYATEIPVSAAVPTKPFPISRLAAIGSHPNRIPISTRNAATAHKATVNATPRWIPPRTHSGRILRSSRRKNNHTPSPDPTRPTAPVHRNADGSEDSRTAKSEAAEPTSNDARPVNSRPATVAPATAAPASRAPGCSTSASTALVCLANTAT